MDAVGDGGERQLFLGQLRPGVLPHLSRDLAVQLADSVGVAGQFEGQHRHAEGFLGVLRVLAAKAEEFFAAQAEQTVVSAEVALQQVGGEMVDARLHRGIGGEDVAGADDLLGLAEPDAAFLHQEPNTFQGQEGGMPLVHVAHVGEDPQGAQGANAADPQQDLLQYAHLLIAAVELGRDQAIIGAVFLQVGVQQVERHPADLHPPDVHLESARAELKLHTERSPLFVPLQGQRQVVEVVLRVVLLLPSLIVEILAEVTLTVEQAHPHQGQPQVGGRFEVVSGQDAQTAGIDRQRLVQAELHGKIGHHHPGTAVASLLEPGLLRQVVGKLFVHHPEMGHETFIALKALQSGLLKDPKHLDRVVAGGFPQFGVQAAEEVDGVRFPAPPEVIGHALECNQLVGQRRNDREFVQHLGKVHIGNPYLINWFISNMGNRTAMTTTPTATPMPRTSSGSIRPIRRVRRALNSRS